MLCQWHKMATVEKTCSCFGHSAVDITEDLIARTRTEIEKAIEDGVRIFLFGGKSDFDDLCYDIVNETRIDSSQFNIKRGLAYAAETTERTFLTGGFFYGGRKPFF